MRSPPKLWMALLLCAVAPVLAGGLWVMAYFVRLPSDETIAKARSFSDVFPQRTWSTRSAGSFPTSFESYPKHLRCSICDSARSGLWPKKDISCVNFFGMQIGKRLASGISDRGPSFIIKSYALWLAVRLRLNRDSLARTYLAIYGYRGSFRSVDDVCSHYFHKGCAELSLEESPLLAAWIQGDRSFRDAQAKQGKSNRPGPQDCNW